VRPAQRQERERVQAEWARRPPQTFEEFQVFVRRWRRLLFLLDGSIVWTTKSMTLLEGVLGRGGQTVMLALNRLFEDQHTRQAAPSTGALTS